MDDDAAGAGGSRYRRLARLVGWVLFSLGGLLLAATVGDERRDHSAGWSDGGATGSGGTAGDTPTDHGTTERADSADDEEDWVGTVVSGGLLLLFVVAAALFTRPTGPGEYVAWTFVAVAAWLVASAGLSYVGLVPLGALAAGSLAALWASLALAAMLLAAVFTLLAFLLAVTVADPTGFLFAVVVAVGSFLFGVVCLRELDADRNLGRRSAAAAATLFALFGLVAVPAQAPGLLAGPLPLVAAPVSVADRVAVFVGVLPVPAGKVVASLVGGGTDAAPTPRRRLARVVATVAVAASLFVLVAWGTSLLAVDLGGLTALVFLLSVAATTLTDLQSVVVGGGT